MFCNMLLPFWIFSKKGKVKMTSVQKKIEIYKKALEVVNDAIREKISGKIVKIMKVKKADISEFTYNFQDGRTITVDKLNIEGLDLSTRNQDGKAFQKYKGSFEVK